jgi:hypothetical protein
MPSKRNQQNIRRHADQLADAIETEPSFSFERIALPSEIVGPLDRAVSAAVEKPSLRSRGVQFRAEDVDCCLGKIHDPAGMIEIKMREHNVAHVGGFVPEAFELAQSGVLFAQPYAIGYPEEPAEPLRLRHITRPETGIDENEPDVGLDQEAVAGQFGGAQQGIAAVP